MEREARQAPLRSHSSRNLKETLLTLEGGIALDFAQFSRSSVPGGAPPFGYACHVPGSVDGLLYREPSLLQEPRVSSNRHEEKESNRAPNRDLFIRERPRHHNRVREDEMSARAQ
jgi:hypothetical protein